MLSLAICALVCVCVCVCVSCNSPGKNTGVGSHSLLQGIFPTQGLNPDLLLCRQILYHCANWEAQRLSLFTSKTSILFQMTPWILTRYSVICLCNEGQHFEVRSYPFQIAPEPTIWKSIRIPLVQTFFSHPLLVKLLEGRFLKGSSDGRKQRKGDWSFTGCLQLFPSRLRTQGRE